jgi:hypothetical protein
MNNLSKVFLETAGRHFVSLSCVQLLPSGEEKIHVFSGFLINVCNHSFYVTAGHVLHGIKEALAAGSKFDIWRLDDQTAGKKLKAVPYNFEVDLWQVIEDTAFGFDYAAVPLDFLSCQNLSAGDAIPIESGAWGDNSTAHDFWMVIGIPSETVEYHQENFITGRVVAMPLES